ncbi:VOC family protein [Desnuesiella massiliensis]|uniref:VOC family protein n=1 Tax=Desnuesiella massiliensis TaxID=1650662 RepID=UPI0006E25BBC|nr:VOC family protein [Desnuesiella massiliensis]
MKFADICIITNNVLDVAEFYETVFSTKAEGDNIHSFINAAGLGIAIYDKNEAEKVMGFDFSNTGTGLITINFNVDDIEAEYERIKALNINGTTEPHLWPWGAKSFRFKDIEGNIIVFRS